jgi:hypothetical protein
LDSNDRLGAGQAQHQTGIILLQLHDLGGERVGLVDFRATPGGCQRAESAGVAQAAPVAQGRGVEAFAAQDRADPASRGSPIDIGEDAQLVGSAERAAAGAGGEFGVRGVRCRHHRRPTASVGTTTGRRLELAGEHGHD